MPWTRDQVDRIVAKATPDQRIEQRIMRAKS